MALICFDFDRTLVRGHWHNELNHARVRPGCNELQYINSDEAKWPQPLQGEIKRILNILDKLLHTYETAIRNPIKIKNIFKTLFDEKHKIAITSFSDYPEVITFVLKKISLTKDTDLNNKIILTDKNLADIKIIEAPKNKKQNKNNQIKEAMIEHNIKNNEDVYLIDDDFKNYSGAIEIKQKAILIRNDDDLEKIIPKVMGEISSPVINTTPVVSPRFITPYASPIYFCESSPIIGTLSFGANSNASSSNSKFLSTGDILKQFQQSPPIPPIKTYAEALIKPVSYLEIAKRPLSPSIFKTDPEATWETNLNNSRGKNRSPSPSP